MAAPVTPVAPALCRCVFRYFAYAPLFQYKVCLGLELPQNILPFHCLHILLTLTGHQCVCGLVRHVSRDQMAMPEISLMCLHPPDATFWLQADCLYP